MIYGFKHHAVLDLPEWGRVLSVHYWVVRNSRFNGSKRRKAYRAIKKEKLRLVELGYSIFLVNALCKYLVTLSEVNAKRFEALRDYQDRQYTFDFT